MGTEPVIQARIVAATLCLSRYCKVPMAALQRCTLNDEFPAGTLSVHMKVKK